MQIAVGQPAHQVAGLIDPLAQAEQFQFDEFLRRQRRLAQIAPRQAHAGDGQFPRNADRLWLPVSVQHIDAGVRQGLAYRHPCGIVRRQAAGRGDNGVLGWAVGVEQHRIVGEMAQPAPHTLLGQSFAAHQHQADGFRPVPAQDFAVGQQALPIRRRQAQQAHPRLAAAVEKVQGAVDRAVRAQHQRRAVQQRGEDFLHRGVKTDRGELQYAVSGTDLVAFPQRIGEVQQRTVGDLHTFGLTGGA